MNEYEKCLLQEIAQEVAGLLEKFKKNGLDSNNPITQSVDRIGVLAGLLLNPTKESS